MANSTNAQTGAGVTLSQRTGSPFAYQSLGNVIRGISGIGTKRSEVDSTTLDSIEDEFVSTISSGGTPSITFAAGSAILATCEALVAAGVAVRFKLTAPAPASISRYFDMVPLGVDHGSFSVKGLWEITLTGRITGGISAVA